VSGQVRWIIGLQVAVSVVIALVCLVALGVNAAWSAFLGGAIGFTGSFAYARKIATPQTRDPKDLLRGHLVGEVLKLGLTVILFAAVFTLYKEVAALPLLLTFMATLAMYWVALLIVF